MVERHGESGRADRASMHSVSAIHTTEITAFYDSFHRIGLQYGPSYRPLLEVWACDGRATAQLFARTDLQGTQVHPADLDGALQLSVRAESAQHVDKSVVRLPFAVDGALLQGTTRSACWAVRIRIPVPAVHLLQLLC